MQMLNASGLKSGRSETSVLLALCLLLRSGDVTKVATNKDVTLDRPSWLARSRLPCRFSRRREEVPETSLLLITPFTLLICIYMAHARARRHAREHARTHAEHLGLKRQLIELSYKNYNNKSQMMHIRVSTDNLCLIINNWGCGRFRFYIYYRYISLYMYMF